MSLYIQCVILNVDQNGIVSIGDDVSIAHAVTILAVNHRYDSLDIPIKEQGIEEGETIIEDNVWIGAKVTILMNRKVESGAIVAANCVVTKDVKSNTIVGKNPNSVLKERK